MARKNIKVPEALFLALRDDKPDTLSWPAYLERECLTGKDELKRIGEQLERVESAAQTAEERTGRIEQALEDMGARR
jgi:hypothetical protein